MGEDNFYSDERIESSVSSYKRHQNRAVNCFVARIALLREAQNNREPEAFRSLLQTLLDSQRHR
jgi:hypothetical protein